MPGKRFIFALAASLGFSLASALPSGAQADPGTIAKDFVAALNTGDSNAALALFADGATVQNGVCGRLFGPQGCVGKAQLRQVFAMVAGTNDHVTVVKQVVSGNTVTETAEETATPIRAAGVQRIVQTSVFTIQGNLIASVRVTLDTSDPQTARFLAFQQAHAASPPKSGGLPKTGGGGMAVGSNRAAAILAVLVALVAYASGAACGRPWRWARRPRS